MTIEDFESRLASIEKRLTVLERDLRGREQDRDRTRTEKHATKRSFRGRRKSASRSGEDKPKFVPRYKRRQQTPKP